jgi:hypothetical protein
MHDRARRLAEFQWTNHRGRVVTGLPAHDPAIVGADMPPVAWFVDEAHMVIGHGILSPAALEQLAKAALKTGMFLVLVTHYPDGEAFGGKIGLRNQLKAGNITCFRNGTHLAGGMLLPAGYPGPDTIPQVLEDGLPPQGVALLAAPVAGSSRPMLMRTQLDEDPDASAEDAAHLMGTLTPHEAQVVGPAYLTRHERRRTDPPTPPPAEWSAGGIPTEPPTGAADSATERVYRVIAAAGPDGCSRGAIIAAGVCAERTVDAALLGLGDRITKHKRGVYAVAGTAPGTAADLDSAVTAPPTSDDDAPQPGQERS